jgi:dTDP-4-dehydrorhamnose 3,5-epimerase
MMSMVFPTPCNLGIYQVSNHLYDANQTLKGAVVPMNPGEKDKQSVTANGDRATPFSIIGVHTITLNNVLTRSGAVTELFSLDWRAISIEPKHVILATMNPGAVTDWHRHEQQSDHLIGISGSIKLALWDGRADSATRGNHEVIRIGILRPQIVVVPPGVWHGLRNESGVSAHYINVTDVPYNHLDPDNFRLSSERDDLPVVL